jgi:hypothetical protein
MVEKNRRAIECGKVKIEFIAKKNLAQCATNTFNTPKGTIRVGAPEVTALDLAT